MNLPSVWEFGVATLAVFRLFHLIAEDTILDRPRRWALRMDPAWEKEGDNPGENYRFHWAIFITCPWCLGAWLSLAAVLVYCAVIEWLGVLSLLTVWFALSGAVALIATIHSAITED